MMIVKDKGHRYLLKELDGSGKQEIKFVKRVGYKYPGNVKPEYPGLQNQDLLRVLIDRTLYLDSRERHWVNSICFWLYRLALFLLEFRASSKKELFLNPFLITRIEKLKTCRHCHHVRCNH